MNVKKTPKTWINLFHLIEIRKKKSLCKYLWYPKQWINRVISKHLNNCLLPPYKITLPQEYNIIQPDDLSVLSSWAPFKPAPYKMHACQKKCFIECVRWELDMLQCWVSVLPSLPEDSSPWWSLDTRLLCETHRRGCRGSYCCCRFLSRSTNTQASKERDRDSEWLTGWETQTHRGYLICCLALTRLCSTSEGQNARQEAHRQVNKTANRS